MNKRTDAVNQRDATNCGSSVIIVNGSRMSMLLINLLTVRATIDRMKIQSSLYIAER